MIDLMARQSASLFRLRLTLLCSCVGALWLLKSQENAFPPIPDLTLPSMEMGNVDIERISIQTAMPVKIGAVDLNASCDSLNIDAEQAQAIELKSSCSEQERSGDTSLYIVICNVKPAQKSDLNTTLLLPKAVGKLRHDWSHHPPLSRFAKAIDAHQSNCSLPVNTFHLDNSYGMGSHIALWSQAMCNSMEAGFRLRTYNPIWLWLDQTFCNRAVAEKSPWLCYLPGSEFKCGCEETPLLSNDNASDPRDLKRHQCALLRGNGEDVLREFRAASTEFLFHRIAPLVIQEARRQVGLLFGAKGTPDDLITVHVRWGDKFWEMPNRTLVAVQTYMDAISTLLQETQGHNRTANIYLATEDPRAYREFKNATPAGWNIYFDRTVEELHRFRPPKGNRASHMSMNSKGRAGLAGLASLLVAMEAKLFVLTTKSNWSSVINHLRKNVIDPRCNDCTKMIDLVSGVW